GQGHTHHRQKPAHHTDVDEGIDEKRESQTAGQQAFEAVLGHGGNKQAASDDHNIEGQQEQHALQAKLLRQHGEEKVGLSLGQEVEARLHAVEPTLAMYATGTDRGLRLDDVPAGAERIAVRIQQGQYAALLVVLQHVEPHRRNGCQHHYDGAEHQLPAHTRQQQHEDTRSSDENGSTEVGLPPG